MNGTWRDDAAPFIAMAIEEGRAAGLEGKALWRYVSGLRPYMFRVTSHGDKIWRSEMHRQLDSPGRELGQRHRPPDAAGQLTLFAEPAQTTGKGVAR